MVQKHVVIVGGGYGGVACAQALSKYREDFRITVIDPKPYHLITHMLYESASAFPEHGTQVDALFCLPFDQLFASSVTHLQSEVIAIDTASKTVTTTGGAIVYDTLVIGIGCIPNYFGIGSIKLHAHTPKTLEGAQNLRTAWYEVLRDPQKSSAHVSIVGGGYTGIELAGELVTAGRAYCKKHNISKDIRATIFEAGSAILPTASPTTRNSAMKRLAALNINVSLGARVTDCTSGTITVNSTSSPTDCIAWTTGIAPHPLIEKSIPHEKGYALTDSNLQVTDDVFAIGDCMKLKGIPDRDQKPKTAQSAMMQGYTVAHTIIAQTQSKLPPAPVYRPVFFVDPIGGAWAVCEVGPISFAGVIGYYMKMFSIIMYLVHFLPIAKAISHWRAIIRACRLND